mgnify:CR=1 FL=1
MLKRLLHFRAVLKTLHAGCLVTAVVLLFASYHTADTATIPAERILSFDSRISVNPDASMLVTETIRVLSTGDRILRGIFRDFPTTYKDRAGNRFTVGFTVQAILRNGQPEDWHTENLSNGVRVYIGDKNTLVGHGEHTWVLTYRTDRQVGFFDTVSVPIDKTSLFNTLHRACGNLVTSTGVVRLADRHAALGPLTPRLDILLAEPNGTV